VQGEPIGKTEATEAFFAMTKLFQSRDVSCRWLLFSLVLPQLHSFLKPFTYTNPFQVQFFEQLTGSKLSEIKFCCLYRKSRSLSNNMTSDFAPEVDKIPEK